MTCGPSRSVAMLVTASCAELLVACAGGVDHAGTGTVRATSTTPTTAAPRAPAPEPAAAAMATAARQLLTVDHTFGSGSTPFTTFLVLDHTDPEAGAGGPLAPTGSSRPLTDGERSAIEARLDPLGEVVWIADPADHRTQDLRPTVEGSAIVGLGEPEIGAGTALVPVSLWCGGLCGTWFTYSLASDGFDGWTVQGIEGPRAIS